MKGKDKTGAVCFLTARKEAVRRGSGGTPVIPALGTHAQEDEAFKTSLSKLRATTALRETPSQNQKQDQQAKVEKNIKTCVFMAGEKYIAYN